MGKDGKKRKNKKRDVNSRTKAGHGTDMDVFIDDLHVTTAAVTTASTTSTSSTSAAASAEVSSAQVTSAASAEVSAAQVTSVEVSSAQVTSAASAEVSAAQVTSVEVSSAQVTSAVSAEVSAAQVSAEEVPAGVSAEVSAAEVSAGVSAEVSAAEVSAGAAAVSAEVSLPAGDDAGPTADNEDGCHGDKDLAEADNDDVTDDRVSCHVGEDEGRHGDAVEDAALTPGDDNDKDKDDDESAACATETLTVTDTSMPADDVIAMETLDAIAMETPVDDDVIDESSTTEESRPELKYQYSEDQWSPLNPEGKKQYDRSFMLQLQYVPSSVTRPANLPSLPDIILSEPPHMRGDNMRHRSVELGRSAVGTPDFTPGFIKSSPSGGRRPQRFDRSASSTKKGEMLPVVAARPRVIQVSLQHDVKLNKAENAWKPVLNKKDLNEDDGDAATQELYKKVRGILNKLTPQKFKTLIQQVLDLNIDTEKRLKGCIDIIFEKAISEPNFSVAYANMANCMLNLNVPKEADASQTVGFRSLLLNKCQQEFEKDKVEELDIAERQKLIDEATSVEHRRQLVDELHQVASKAKRRSLGNIRFIGELYKLRMLTETIMHDCLFKLLRSSDEDSLECLCQLLMTIGQELDNKQSKMQSRMDRYFNQLASLVDEKKTSSRIRFLLRDTIDLRKNNWVPRREKNNPKTIEQIHREAQEEIQQRQAAMQRASIEQRSAPVPVGRRPAGGRSGGPPAAGVCDDGWTAVSRPPKSNIVDPSRLKLTKREQVDDSCIQLGPSGRGMGWHRGSSGGGKQSAVSQDIDLRQPNRYSALSGGAGMDMSDARNRSAGRSAAAAGGSSSLASAASVRDYQGRLSGPASRSSLTPRSSQERNFDTGTMTGIARVERVTPTSSRAGSGEAGVIARPAGDARQRPTTEMSEDELRRKTKSIIDEYLHLNDLKEVTACVDSELKSASMSMFVNECLLLTVERSSTARHHTGAMLHHLLRGRFITLSNYVEGLHDFLSIADDMVIDVPRIWQYIAELISPMLLDDDSEIPLDFLRRACSPLLSCEGGDKAAVVISMVLLDAVHSLGHHTVAEMWQKSGLQWSEFLSDPDKVDEFLSKNQVEFTVKLRPVSVKSADDSAPSCVSSSDALYSELARLLRDDDVDNEVVIDWIDENVSEVNGEFIRALTTAAYTPALQVTDDAFSVQQELVKRRSSLLQKYIRHDVKFELEALYAVQLIVHRHGHPYGALRVLFDVLYDDELVSEESFMQWRDKSHDGEQTGRGVAILSVDQFYKWLEEDTIS